MSCPNEQPTQLTLRANIMSNRIKQALILVGFRDHAGLPQFEYVLQSRHLQLVESHSASPGQSQLRAPFSRSQRALTSECHQAVV